MHVRTQGFTSPRTFYANLVFQTCLCWYTTLDLCFSALREHPSYMFGKHFERNSIFVFLRNRNPETTSPYSTAHRMALAFQKQQVRATYLHWQLPSFLVDYFLHKVNKTCIEKGQVYLQNKQSLITSHSEIKRTDRLSAHSGERSIRHQSRADGSKEKQRDLFRCT